MKASSRRHAAGAIICGGLVTLALLSGCALPFDAASAEATSTLPPPVVEPGMVTATMLSGEAATATEAFIVPATVEPPTSTPAPPTPSIVLTDVPPRTGSFDVYLGAPDESGQQLLRWVDSRTGEKVTEIAIRTDDGLAIRAGQYVYFYAPGTREPQRVNTAGAVQPLSFAAPAPGATYYEFLPSATGDFIAWLSVGADGVFTIRLAGADGSNARQVGGDTLLAGETVHLIRVANDGRRVFFDRRPSQITYQTIFNPRYDLYALDGITGQVARLPGEPACGEARLCDAHISSDGSVLVRTLPPSAAYQQPVVVINLTSGYPLARFAPEGIPTGAAFEIGYPFLTPGGELIFVESYGPPQLERFLLVWGNIVTGEQRVVAELGHDRHRPLGWAADGVTLLTTREPDYYDTWQINIETGAMRQIAAMMFLGHIEQPPSAP